MFCRRPCVLLAVHLHQEGELVPLLGLPIEMAFQPLERKIPEPGEFPLLRLDGEEAIAVAHLHGAEVRVDVPPVGLVPRVPVIGEEPERLATPNDGDDFLTTTAEVLEEQILPREGLRAVVTGEPLHITVPGDPESLLHAEALDEPLLDLENGHVATFLARPAHLLRFPQGEMPRGVFSRAQRVWGRSTSS